MGPISLTIFPSQKNDETLGLLTSKFQPRDRCKILRTKEFVAIWWPRMECQRNEISIEFESLQWRHNGHDVGSNHQRLDCLLNRLFRRRSKKNSKLRINGLCEGNSPVTGVFPAQRASNAENVSIWWRRHVVVQKSLAKWVICGQHAEVKYIEETLRPMRSVTVAIPLQSTLGKED